MKLYEVTGYWAEVRETNPDGTRGKVLRGGRHVGYFVQCESAARACALVEERHPGITIESCNRKGSRELIVDGPHHDGANDG